MSFEADLVFLSTSTPLTQLKYMQVKRVRFLLQLNSRETIRTLLTYQSYHFLSTGTLLTYQCVLCGKKGPRLKECWSFFHDTFISASYRRRRRSATPSPRFCYSKIFACLSSHKQNHSCYIKFVLYRNVQNFMLIKLKIFWFEKSLTLGFNIT